MPAPTTETATSAASRPASILRVGTDLCSVDDVAESLRCFGDRYLRRIYTPAELDYCTKDPFLVTERLAARFAAKEATIKVLRPAGNRPDWTAMEVIRDPNGWCEMALSGTAARLAAVAGIQELSVSLSHDRGLAMAFVVALLSAPESNPHLAEKCALEAGASLPDDNFGHEV